MFKILLKAAAQWFVYVGKYLFMNQLSSHNLDMYVCVCVCVCVGGGAYLLSQEFLREQMRRETLRGENEEGMAWDTKLQDTTQCDPELNK